MKTKLLAVTMMGLATFGSIVGATPTYSDGAEWKNTTAGLTADMWVQGIAWVGENGRTWSRLLTIIKNGVNWVLWLLSLITLCIVLWWGFQMVTAGGVDAKYKKLFTIIKQAGIWLTIILLAWVIISVVFWLVGNLSWSSVAGTGGTK